MTRNAVSEALSLTAIDNELNRWEQQNLALAAVAQCASLVNRIATTGEITQAEYLAAVNPLFALNPDGIGEVYPGAIDLTLGLRTVQAIFSSERGAENNEVVRYTLGMLLLRNRLTARKDMLEQIRQRLTMIEPLQRIPIGADAETESSVLSSQERSCRQLAGLYQDTISTLSYRIQVQGKVEHLKDEQIANQIRALLLAGIRSAVLWYQLGGRRWRLLFYRRRVHEAAGNIRRKLLTSI